MTSAPSLVPTLVGVRAAVVNWRDLEHSQAGGAERYAWEFAKALRERGAEVEFVTARDRGQSRRGLTEGIPILRGGGRFGFYAWAAYYLLSRRRELDVVIDPECGIPVFSPLFVRRRTPVILIVHHIHQRQFAQYFPAPLAKLGQFLEASVMPRVYRRTRTLAVSDSTRDDMRHELRWRGPIELLHNGHDGPQLTSDDDAEQATARTRAVHDNTALAVLGRLVPHKRVDLVIEVVARLRAEDPHCALTLDIVGRGPDEERLRERIQALGLGDVVRLHGFVPDEQKAAILERAGLHVCASDNEGWGQVVIEVAAHGVPTVARDVAGLRDSIIDGRTGWLAPAVPSGGGSAGQNVQDADGSEINFDEVIVAGLTDAVRRGLAELVDPDRESEIRADCRRQAARFDWAQMRADAARMVAEELDRTPV